ncbi:MAG: teichoic acid transporter [Candidatus Sericytochromatia bacterium]|nr:MAG: teichoic acid transporter [Candidatus Sericytochromatia bacterium]
MFFKNKIFENFVSLFIWQLTINLLKLIWIPYVIKILGVGNYGIFTISQSICFYLINIVDYGFNTTATREISINRNNKEELSKIFTSVLLSKIFLIFICFIFLINLINFIPQLSLNKRVYLYSFGIVIGTCLFPFFLFQGLEKMKYITYIDSFFRLISILLIFTFIKNNNDLEKLCIIFSLGYILSGLIGIFFSIFILKISFKYVEFNYIFNQYKKGFDIFVSNLIVNILNNTNNILIGFFIGTKYSAFYSIADKIRVLFISLYSIIINPIYSRICFVYNENRNDYLKKIKAIEKFIFIISILMLLAINIFSDFFIKIFLSEDFKYSIIIIRFLSISVFINGLSFIYSNIFLASTENYKIIRNSYFIGIFIYLISSFVIIHKNINLLTFGINLIISELIITLIFYYEYYSYLKIKKYIC